MQITNAAGNMAGLWESRRRPAQNCNCSNNFEHIRRQLFMQENGVNLQKKQKEDTTAEDEEDAFKTSCHYKLGEEETLIFHTVYEKDRIYCVKEGTDGYEWEIPLNDESQYDRVLSFLNGLENQENQSFTIHSTFWRDFLSGKLNVDEFKDFLSGIDPETAANGFTITENGMFQDAGARKYSSYIYGPSFGTNMLRSTEEFTAWQKQQQAKLQEEYDKNHPSWVEQWNKEHPRLVGTKCFLYTDGQWYTAEEIVKLWAEELSELLARD